MVGYNILQFMKLWLFPVEEDNFNYIDVKHLKALCE